MKKSKLLIFIVAGILLLLCKNYSLKINCPFQAINIAADIYRHDTVTLYKSDNLIIKQLSKDVYLYIYFFNTKSFGKMDCNGMGELNGNEAVIFDSPATGESSVELVSYLKIHTNTITAIIPTHFYEDCVGGLEKFSENNIPWYASIKTIALLKK